MDDPNVAFALAVAFCAGLFTGVLLIAVFALRLYAGERKSDDRR